MQIFQNIFQNPSFKSRSPLIELSFFLDHMPLPTPIILKPLHISQNPQRKEITLGVPPTSFLLATIYKNDIIAGISRYYFSKYKISITFLPISH